LLLDELPRNLFRGSPGAADSDRDLCLRSPQQHYDIIARFGRFPHRNEVLGRSSTVAEAVFLRERGSRF